MPPVIDGVMRRLAHATADTTRAMKLHALQRDLARGLLPRSSYVAWLTQLFFVHRTLEWHLGRLRAVVPPLGAVVHDHYFHTPALASDLACFAVDLRCATRLAPTNVLVDLIDGLAVRAPLSLVGFAYVLEESKNGGRQIALRARLAYRLQPSLGVAYLDPYGDRQRERWRELKTDMEAVGFDADEIGVLATAARRMQESLVTIMDTIVAGEMTDVGRRPAT